MADAESTRADGSPQQAGAEIPQTCGTCCWMKRHDTFGVTVRKCLNRRSDHWLFRVEFDGTCDHWQRRGAE